MPVAIPTWRNVELMPEAMPARSGRTTPTAVEASGGLTSPTPTPETTKPAMRWVQPELPVSPRMSSNPTPTSTSPGPISARTGTWRAEPPRHAAAHEDRAAEDQRAHTGLQRAEAEHVLQVEDEVQQHREDPGGHPEGRDVAAGERGQPEERQVEHRVSDSPLDDDEGDQQHRRRSQADDHRCRAEAAPPRLDERVDEAGQPAGEEHETGPVRTVRLRRPGFAHPHRGQGDGEQTDGQVDEEDPPPGDAGDQRAADQRAHRHGQPGDRTPDAEGDAAVLAAKGVGQQGQRHGEHGRPADSLQAAGQLEHEGVLGRAAQREAAVKMSRPIR